MGIKIKVLPFQGRNNLKAYIEWEKKIEKKLFLILSLIFKSVFFPIEFTKYALAWWD